MKKEYVHNETKEWKCKNEDGTAVDVSIGDKVKIVHNLTELEVSRDFLQRFPKEVELEVRGLNNRCIEGRVIGGFCEHLTLYPKDIVKIEKLVKDNEEFFEFYTDTQINKLQIYIEENFEMGGCSPTLISNILHYVSMQGEDNDITLNMLEELLDGIGITRNEIIKAVTQ